MAISCTLCKKEKSPAAGTQWKESGWWNLMNYKGFTGSCCPACYDHIASLSDEESVALAKVTRTLTDASSPSTPQSPSI
jgi:hypothetical protein